VTTAESEEREDWLQLALQSLAHAYGDDEPEYSRDQIQEANDEYKEDMKTILM
jgi:hypothetical protein